MRMDIIECERIRKREDDHVCLWRTRLVDEDQRVGMYSSWDIPVIVSIGQETLWQCLWNGNKDRTKGTVWFL